MKYKFVILVKEMTEFNKTVASKDHTTSSDDVNSIARNIRQHLEKLNFKRENLAESSTLKIGENEITAECLLYYLSGKKYQLGENPKKCEKEMEPFVVTDKEGNNIVHLEKMIDPSSIHKDQFNNNTNFYYDLYEFNIGLAKKMFNDNLSYMDENVRKMLYSNVQNFISQTLIYLEKYMTVHQIINDTLLTSSYDLLYLSYALASKYIHTGIGINDIKLIYQKLVQQIHDNIGIYQQIDRAKLFGAIETHTNINPKNATELDRLYQELEFNLSSLEKQKNVLEQNVNIFNNQRDKISDLISQKVKLIQ